MESGTTTRRQIIGLIPSSRTLSCRIDPGSAADFTDSMAENYPVPRDSIKVDPTEFCASLVLALADPAGALGPLLRPHNTRFPELVISPFSATDPHLPSRPRPCAERICPAGERPGGTG